MDGKISIPTAEWLLTLEPGTYAFQRADDGYLYSKSTVDHIATTPGLVGITLIDKPFEQLTMPKYMSFIEHNELHHATTQHMGLDVVTLEPGAILYKGMGGRKDRKPADKSVSFYTSNPQFAARFATMGGIGYIQAYRVTRKVQGYMHCYKNNNKILELLDGYGDEDTMKRMKTIFKQVCIATDDMIDVIFRASDNNLIDIPWTLNKHNLRNYVGKPHNCLNKIYLGTTDYRSNMFLLTMGKHLGLEFTYLTAHPLIYSYRRDWLDMGDEYVFYRDSDVLVRDTTHPYDITNWKIDPRYNLPIKMRQMSIETVDRIVDWYHMKNEPKPKTKRYRIMSYNVHGWVPIDSSRDLVQHVEFLIKEHKVDIVFLQEYKHEDKLKVIVPKGAGHLTVAAWVRGGIQYKSTWMTFPRYGDFKYNRERKGMHIIDCTLSGRNLRIIGTHNSIYTGMDEEIRREEIRLIVGQSPDIICGDFNETDDKIDIPADYKRSQFAQTTPFNAVDHFYSKIDCQTWVLFDNTSDHFPIFMDFDV